MRRPIAVLRLAVAGLGLLLIGCEADAPVPGQDAEIQEDATATGDALSEVDGSPPDTADPEPEVVEPEADTADPEPEVVEPEADTADPEPDVVDPEADTADPEPDVVEPEADTAPADTGPADTAPADMLVEPDTGPLECPVEAWPCEWGCYEIVDGVPCKTQKCVDGCCYTEPQADGTTSWQCPESGVPPCAGELYECWSGACVFVGNTYDDDNPCTELEYLTCGTPPANWKKGTGVACPGGTCSAAAECLPGHSACADGEGELYVGGSVRGCDVPWVPPDITEAKQACGVGWHLCTVSEVCGGLGSIIPGVSDPYAILGCTGPPGCEDAVSADMASGWYDWQTFPGPGTCPVQPLQARDTPQSVLCCLD